MENRAPRGTRDVLPIDSGKWQYIEGKIHKVCRQFGYFEIRTPVFEHTELFKRGIGDDTDIVQKEMYTFDDKGGRSITLRPEGTAGAVRAYLEHNLHANTSPSRLYYICSCYRYEKPQAGRLREFHQFGAEMFGAGGATADVEAISMAVELLVSAGLSKLNVGINSVGCGECKSAYNNSLKEYFKGKEVCELCQNRLERNPMRVLDCKNPHCAEIAENAPKMIDILCGECAEHFKSVQDGLAALGIDFVIDSHIVRGLDYYTRTVFEITAGDIGAQNVVCGGGRYDRLVEQFGGKPTPAVGFAMGLERLLLCLEKCDIEVPGSDSPDVYIGWIGEEGRRCALKLAADLRGQAISVDLEVMERSPRAQMKYADKIGAGHSAIIGGDEVESGEFVLRDMRTGEERKYRINDVSTKGVEI
ncbi:MAG: histidine--tRNA ligase [Clostridiales bacterium]|nr:histidine--tRNA ligase [Clostridiales bacterium]